MSTILVTGANGFVGAHLVRELQDHGHSVMPLNGGRSHDLTKPEVTAKIDFSDIDVVMHLAGLAAVGPSFQEPMRYITTNMGIETNLFEAALSQDRRPRFLVISSGSLYDPTSQLPLTETSHVLASSPYAVSKLGQEQMAQYYATRGFEYIIARPFNHIGPGQSLGFIVPDLAQQAVQSHQIMVGNLDSRRDYTDVRDIVRAYRLLAEKGRPGEIYNICSGKALSGHEILKGITALVDRQLTITQDQKRMRPSDTLELRGSHEKLTNDTGWQPEIDMETTLQDVVEEWRAKA